MGKTALSLTGSRTLILLSSFLDRLASAGAFENGVFQRIFGVPGPSSEMKFSEQICPLAQMVEYL
jgi:hypothetical protein